jgi:RNA polymerase sigma factor (sigma-70 family)
MGMTVVAGDRWGARAQDVVPANGHVHDVGRLYAEFSRHLEMLVRSDVRACDAVIEDACQLAWVQLVRYRNRVALDSAPRWLTRTAVREAVRMLRRHRHECSLETLLTEDADGEERSVAADVLTAREKLLDVRCLPRRQQRIVWLRALGLSYDEVASHEACTFRTVDRQLEQARQRLRA